MTETKDPWRELVSAMEEYREAVQAFRTLSRDEQRAVKRTQVAPDGEMSEALWTAWAIENRRREAKRALHKAAEKAALVDP